MADFRTPDLSNAYAEAAGAPGAYQAGQLNAQNLQEAVRKNKEQELTQPSRIASEFFKAQNNANVIPSHAMIDGNGLQDAIVKKYGSIEDGQKAWAEMTPQEHQKDLNEILDSAQVDSKKTGFGIQDLTPVSSQGPHTVARGPNGEHVMVTHAPFDLFNKESVQNKLNEVAQNSQSTSAVKQQGYDMRNQNKLDVADINAQSKIEAEKEKTKRKGIPTAGATTSQDKERLTSDQAIIRSVQALTKAGPFGPAPKENQEQAQKLLQGLQTPSFRKAWLGEGGTQQSPAQQKEGMIKVQKPDGTTGYIPKENRDKAIAQKWKVLD